MSKTFRPRRGKTSTMTGADKATTVLAAGEMFVETPSTGVGTGESNIKLGDGTTAYSSLPYALGSSAPTSITSDSSTTATAALNNASSGSSLKSILGALKQAVSLNSSSITTLNDTLSGPSNSLNVLDIAIAITTTLWVSTTVNSTTYYKYTQSINHIYDNNPSICIGSTGTNILPTSDEQDSYNFISYTTIDTTVPAIYLYATSVPTTAFNIKIKGVS